MSKVTVWQEREAIVNVSSKLRTDLKRHNLQRSRENYFSPPKKPWDFSTFSQPKRLWEISPQYRREVQRGNTLSALPYEVPKEVRNDTCHESRTICGLFPDNPGIGRQRWHENALYQENPTESKPSALTKTIESNSEQVKVSINESSPKISPPSWVDGSNPSLKPCSQDDTRPFTSAKLCPSWLDGSNSSSKKSTQDDRIRFTSPALQEGPDTGLRQRMLLEPLKAKEKEELLEIQGLKVQMALLYEKLASYILQGDGCTEADVFRLKEFKLSETVGESGKAFFNELAVRADERTIDQKLGMGNHPVNHEKDKLIVRFKSQVWKVGLRTMFQILVWYLVMIRPVIRCIRSLRYLPPT